MPYQHIAVDEAMVPFKGRLAIKQYMKEKPCKFGVKLWVCADSQTGYCFALEVYTGKHGNRVHRLMGMSARVVIGVTKYLQNFGYIVYTDNFYTSPVLAKYLLKKNTYLCGTMRPNRIGYPRDLMKTKAEARRLPRGSSEWRQSGDLVATAWKDKRMVYYLSTAHAPVAATPGTARRRQADGSVIEIDSPPTVTGYAKYMNGVDKLDQMTRQNKSKKVMKWFRRVELKLLECSIYNAYVIEGEATGERREPGGPAFHSKDRGMLQFKLDLAHQLIGGAITEKTRFGRPRKEETENDPRLDRRDHWPIKGVGSDHVCVVCAAKHNRYRREQEGRVPYNQNPYSKTKTTIKCEKCDVYLCLSAARNCFKQYHTVVTYV